MPASARSAWHTWIHRQVQRGWPTRVHLALETGDASLRGGLPVHDSPRFSLCLAGEGRYTVLRQHRREVIALARGEAIVAAPLALMEPHRSACYLAMGFVFTPSMTRLLLAKQSAGRHRFLHTRHDSALLDQDGRHFFQALQHRKDTATDDLIRRRLVELLLLKTAEIAALPERAMIGRGKARFTWLAACQFLEENLHHPIGRQEVADFLHIHPNHVSRLFREFSARSFQDHLMDARLQRARGLLTNPALNIAQVAEACGFRDANYFIRSHKQRLGDTPGRLRTRLAHFTGSASPTDADRSTESAGL